MTETQNTTQTTKLNPNLFWYDFVDDCYRNADEDDKAYTLDQYYAACFGDIAIEPGDFIKIEEPHRSASYTEAHVYGKTANGDLRIAYGSMTQDSFYWLYMGGDATVATKYVSEVWRKLHGKWTLVS